MAYTLQQLSDFEDIRTLKHRYFRAIDTADAKLLEGLFTEDVAVEYRGGSYKVELQGREKMIDFLLNSFNSDSVAMHHGHMPEITLTSDDTAKGIWYLEDIFIALDRNEYTLGSALYYDDYVRENGTWKIARTEYDRVIELVEPLREEIQIHAHMLARKGRKPEERGDVSNYIKWFKAS